MRSGVGAASDAACDRKSPANTYDKGMALGLLKDGAKGASEAHASAVPASYEGGSHLATAKQAVRCQDAESGSLSRM